MFRRILVPLDGSKQSLAALETAKSLSRLAGSDLVLVRVPGVPDEPDVSAVLPVPAEAQAREEARCRRSLQRLAAQLFDDGFPVSWRVLAGHSDPSLPILAAVTDYEIDLVVMTSHGRRGLGRFLKGSVAEHVARECTCPVLLVGPKTRPVQELKESSQD